MHICSSISGLFKDNHLDQGKYTPYCSDNIIVCACIQTIQLIVFKKSACKLVAAALLVFVYKCLLILTNFKADKPFDILQQETKLFANWLFIMISTNIWRLKF